MDYKALARALSIFTNLSPEAAEEFLRLPDRLTDVITDYSLLLAGFEDENPRRLIRPISLLPHPKDKIEAALREALETVETTDLRSSLEAVFYALHGFVPQEKVPTDPKDDGTIFFTLLSNEIDSRSQSLKECSACKMFNPPKATRCLCGQQLFWFPA
jgi:hypothetical protein